MQLIAFTRPDGRQTWINPEQVAYVTANADHGSMDWTEVATAAGKVVVKEKDLDVAAQLGGHITA